MSSDEVKQDDTAIIQPSTTEIVVETTTITTASAVEIPPSTTTTTIATTSSGTNGNGKREREEDVVVNEQHQQHDHDITDGESATKQLKSSDDSDNKDDEERGGFSSGRSSVASHDDQSQLPVLPPPPTATTETTAAINDTSSTTTAVAAVVSNEKPITDASSSSSSHEPSNETAVGVTTLTPTLETATVPDDNVPTIPTTTQNEPNVTLKTTDEMISAAAAATSTTTTNVDIPIDPRGGVTSTNVVVVPNDATTTSTVINPMNESTVVSNTINDGMDPNIAATVTNPDQLVEETGTVPAMYVGRVIGKGGEMIRDLQARSGARIDVDQNVPIGQPRVITYRGTRETVDFAKHLVQLLCTDGVHDNDLPLGNAAQEYVIIPAQSVGKIIGRGGEMIRELQSRSQAKIQIDHTGQSGIPSDQKQVTITGAPEAVVKGKEMVLLLVANPLMDAQISLNMLVDDKVRGGSKWGSGPPYPNLPNQGINMQSHMAPTQIHGQTSGYNMYGQPSNTMTPNPMATTNMMVGGYTQQMVPPVNYTSGYPSVPSDSQHSYLSDGRESELLFVSKQFMGRIIGSKGVTINDLQRRSACDIQINQDVPPGRDCEITIKGSRIGIDTAKAMIQEIIEVGPQHPYAGGMGTYGKQIGVGGGGSGGMAGGYHGAYVQPQYQQQQQQQQQYNPYQQQQVAYDPSMYSQPAYSPQIGVGGYGSQSMGGGSGYVQPMPQQQPQAQMQQHSVPYGTQPYGATGGYAAATGIPPQQQQQIPMAVPQQMSVPVQRQVAPIAVSSWKAASSQDGQIYYYNELTGETQWEKPPGMP